MRDYAESHVSKRTFDGYRGNLDRYLIPNLGSISLEKLTPRHVQDMESKLVREGGKHGRPLTHRTVVQAHRVLSKALNYAVKLGIVNRNVAAPVEPLRTTKYEAETLGWKQVHSFLEQISDPTQRTLVLLDIQTGLRGSELLGLRWRDVNLSDGTLSVQRALVKLPSGGTELTVPKSGNGRVVDLTQESVEALRAHLGRNQETSGNGKFVYCHSDGSYLDPDSVSKSFRKIVKLTGRQGLRLHDLRHTHATVLLTSRVLVHVVPARLGHASIQTTVDTYGHVIPASDVEAGRVIERKLAA